MPIWNPAMETMPRDELEQLQTARLREVVARMAASIPFYHDKLAKAGVNPFDISSVNDLRNLPFTTKDDLRENYPYGMFAVPMRDIVRIHASSGTTGQPVVGGYTQADLDLWGELMARTVTAAGVGSDDIAHNAYGYGLFTGGLGFHLGFQKVGATVVPISGGFTQRQIRLLEDFQATVLTCTPSYALVLAEAAQDMGLEFRERMKLRVGFFGAEPWGERLRQEIEARLGLEAYDIYGLTEIIGPGVSVECEEHAGLHIFEDHFLPEVIDPESGQPLPAGEAGELVITTLTKQAMPLLRFRTRDRVTLNFDSCACGRTLARMSKVLGRTDDMLIIRGVNVFPQLVEQTLLEVEGLAPQYQILVDREKDKLDTLEIRVEAAAEYFDPVNTSRLDELRARAQAALLQSLGVTAQVELVAPRQIERSEGKARRVIDKREI